MLMCVLGGGKSRDPKIKSYWTPGWEATRQYGDEKRLLSKIPEHLHPGKLLMERED